MFGTEHVLKGSHKFTYILGKVCTCRIINGMPGEAHKQSTKIGSDI